MAKIESYSNLTKLQDDLVKKGYCFGHLVALALYTKHESGLSTKTSLKQVKSTTDTPNVTGSTYFKFADAGLLLKQEFQTSLLYKSTLEYTPESYKQIKDKLEIEVNRATGAIKETASVEYSNDSLKSKIAVASDKFVKLSAVKSFGKFGGGVDVAFDLNQTRFSAYNAAIYYFADQYRAVLKHVSTDAKAYTFGNLVGSVHYNYSDSTKVGGAVTVSNAGSANIIVGLQHTLSPNKTFKARVDEQGVFGWNLRTKISQYVSVTTANQMNIKSFTGSENPNWQLGLRIKLNQ